MWSNWPEFGRTAHALVKYGPYVVYTSISLVEMAQTCPPRIWLRWPRFGRKMQLVEHVLGSINARLGLVDICRDIGRTIVKVVKAGTHQPDSCSNSSQISRSETDRNYLDIGTRVKIRTVCWRRLVSTRGLLVRMRRDGSAAPKFSGQAVMFICRAHADVRHVAQRGGRSLSRVPSPCGPSTDHVAEAACTATPAARRPRNTACHSLCRARRSRQSPGSCTSCNVFAIPRAPLGVAQGPLHAPRPT